MERLHLLRSSSGIDHYLINDGDETRFESVSAIDPVLEQNKAERGHNDGYSQSRELRRVARIPYIVLLKWLNEEGWWAFDPDAAGKLAAKLNDPDWAHLRTADGRIGYSNGVIR